MQRVRLALWGETLGLAPDSSTSFNPLLNRQDIRPAIESALCHLQLLLEKADIVTDRYELQGEEADKHTVADIHLHQSVGLTIFRERFALLKENLRKNQKEKSTWTVTRWAVHDLARFKDIVTNIRDMMDGLEGITSPLGVLQRQRALLAEEIESISDVQSLRLLQQVAFSDEASVSLRLASETASVRASLLDDSLSIDGLDKIDQESNQFFGADNNLHHSQTDHSPSTAPSANNSRGTDLGVESRSIDGDKGSTSIVSFSGPLKSPALDTLWERLLLCRMEWRLTRVVEECIQMLSEGGSRAEERSFRRAIFWGNHCRKLTSYIHHNLTMKRIVVEYKFRSFRHHHLNPLPLSASPSRCITTSERDREYKEPRLPNSAVTRHGEMQMRMERFVHENFMLALQNVLVQYESRWKKGRKPAPNQLGQ